MAPARPVPGVALATAAALWVLVAGARADETADVV